jgi:hypothetical protein
LHADNFTALQVDLDRVFKRLLIDGYLVEDTEVSIHGSVVSYLKSGKRPPPQPFLKLKFVSKKRGGDADEDIEVDNNEELEHPKQIALMAELKDVVREHAEKR